MSCYMSCVTYCHNVCLAGHLFLFAHMCFDTWIFECGGHVRWRTKGGMSERENALLRLGLGVRLIHCTAVSSLSLNVVVSSSLVPVLVLNVPLVRIRAYIHRCMIHACVDM